jgi:hypothetical protein
MLHLAKNLHLVFFTFEFRLLYRVKICVHLHRTKSPIRTPTKLINICKNTAVYNKNKCLLCNVRKIKKNKKIPLALYDPFQKRKDLDQD